MQGVGVCVSVCVCVLACTLTHMPMCACLHVVEDFDKETKMRKLLCGLENWLLAYRQSIEKRAPGISHA